MARRARLTFAIAALACTTACGDSNPTGLTPVASTPPDTVGNGAVVAALLIDPTALPRYAGQVLPATFAPPVLQR
ncbi:MAG: hypothetical protein FJ207_06535 [Gemmatimonadetes bacterium]|nr:hypothetical protein [Gemmatimonadota bacterium]